MADLSKIRALLSEYDEANREDNDRDAEEYAQAIIAAVREVAAQADAQPACFTDGVEQQATDGGPNPYYIGDSAGSDDAALNAQPAVARGYSDDDRKRIVAGLQSARDRMARLLPKHFGEGFDGDIDAMLDAINYLKRAQPAVAAVPEGWQEMAARWLEQQADEQEKNNARWPKHAASYDLWSKMPVQLRMLATRVRRAAPAAPASEGVVSENIRKLVGRIDAYRLCMSYNESYFGEPVGLLKGVFAELAPAVNAIYPNGTTTMLAAASKPAAKPGEVPRG